MSGAVNSLLTYLEIVPVSKSALFVCLGVLLLYALRLRSRNKASISEMDQLRARSQELSQKNSETVKHCDELRSQNAAIGADLRRMAQQRTLAEKRCSDLLREIDRLRSELPQEKPEELSDVAAFKNDLLQRYHRKISQVESTYAAQVQKNSETVKHCDELQSQNIALSADLRRITQQSALADGRCSDLLREIDRLRSELSQKKSEELSDVAAFKSDLLQRYQQKVSQVESTYATQFQAKFEDAPLAQHLPKSLRDQLSAPLTPDIMKRFSSALSEDIFLCGSISCSASIRGASGHIYQTSLISCTCDDFKHRGGPCKHMFSLLFALSGSSCSEFAAEQQIHELLALQAKSEKKAASDERTIARLQKEAHTLRCELNAHKENLQTLLSSNLSSIPWLAGMMADYLTYDLEMKAKYLAWGHNQKRLKKVEDIRSIRADAKARIADAKSAVYQLEYLRQLYPGIDDVLDTDYRELELSSSIPEHDPTRDYLSKEEWASLSSAEKDQLALDRYVQKSNKSNWQIGRDYELSVAYECSHHGYSVDTFGSRKGLEDLGRDILAFKPDHTLIIQCKYWSKHKTIHEKHIFQLYGTLVMYRIDHPSILCPVSGVFITNTVLSDTAREVAKILNITVVENHEMIEFPRIKCNIGRSEDGPTHIYHLPMDAQYDVVQIKDPGEFCAFTVQEAIDAGFRRAYKWHSSK